jgi:sigma54-dependent transcription regulator
MTTPDRGEHVAGLVEEMRRHVSHTLGLTVLSSTARDELVAFVTLMETEVAGRSRQISARLEAYRLALSAAGRVDATTSQPAALRILESEHDVDLRTAAELLGWKEDTLRRALREKRIEGVPVNGRWRVPVSAIDTEIARRRAS